jgi:hypothetical protein
MHKDNPPRVDLPLKKKRKEKKRKERSLAWICSPFRLKQENKAKPKKNDLFAATMLFLLILV